MNKDKRGADTSELTKQNGSQDLLDTEISRRKALLKIGKFSSYAAPIAIAILASNPAHPQGISSA